MSRTYAQVAATAPKKILVEEPIVETKTGKELTLDDFPTVGNVDRDTKSTKEDVAEVEGTRSAEVEIDKVIAGFAKLEERLKRENALLVQLPVGKPSIEYPEVEYAPRYISKFIDATKFPKMARSLTFRADRSRSSMPRFPLPREMRASIMQCDSQEYQMIAIRIKASAEMVKLRNARFIPRAHIKPAVDGTWTSVLLIINNYPGKWAAFEDHYDLGVEVMKEMITMRHEHRVHKKYLTCFDGCHHCPFGSSIGEPGIDVFTNMLLGMDEDFTIV